MKEKSGKELKSRVGATSLRFVEEFESEKNFALWEAAEEKKKKEIIKIIEKEKKEKEEAEMRALEEKRKEKARSLVVKIQSQ